jgi:hypothetical protein
MMWCATPAVPATLHAAQNRASGHPQAAQKIVLFRRFTV